MTHAEKTGPQIALPVLAEQAYETITMKIKMNNKFNRGDLHNFYTGCTKSLNR